MVQDIGQTRFFACRKVLLKLILRISIFLVFFPPGFHSSCSPYNNSVCCHQAHCSSHTVILISITGEKKRNTEGGSSRNDKKETIRNWHQKPYSVVKKAQKKRKKKKVVLWSFCVQGSKRFTSLFMRVQCQRMSDLLASIQLVIC